MVAPLAASIVLAASSLSSAGLEHALRDHGVRAPACHVATTAERAGSSFRRTRHLFVCRMTVHRQRARYDVQVLANRCYVAERHVPGQAVYGCAKR